MVIAFGVDSNDEDGSPLHSAFASERHWASRNTVFA